MHSALSLQLGSVLSGARNHSHPCLMSLLEHTSRAHVILKTVLHLSRVGWQSMQRLFHFYPPPLSAGQKRCLSLGFCQQRTRPRGRVSQRRGRCSAQMRRHAPQMAADPLCCADTPTPATRHTSASLALPDCACQSLPHSCTNSLMQQMPRAMTSILTNDFDTTGRFTSRKIETFAF